MQKNIGYRGAQQGNDRAEKCTNRNGFLNVFPHRFRAHRNQQFQEVRSPVSNHKAVDDESVEQEQDKIQDSIQTP